MPKLSQTPGSIRWIGRDTGADTGSVLRAELNLSDDAIEDLARAGIIAGPDLPNRSDQS